MARWGGGEAPTGGRRGAEAGAGRAPRPGATGMGEWNEYTGVTTPSGRGAPWRPRARFVNVSRQESSDKANVSTQEGVPPQDSRVPRPDVDAGRPERAQGAPPQGTEAPHADRPPLTGGSSLGGRGRFARVRSWRCAGRAGQVRVQAAPNGREDTRLGLSVPGLPGAVERNRARRRLREAARGLDAHHGFDLVVSTDASALTVPFALLRGQVETAAVAAVGLARAASGPVAPAAGARARSRQGEGRPGRPSGGRAGEP